MPKLCLFDASGYLHRAYHALPMLTNSKGEPVNALYGFTRMISKVLKSDTPDYMAVCFDTAAPTFRHVAYTEYKAHRKETDEALIFQLPYAEKLVRAWGLPVAMKDGYEADDVIATLAQHGRRLGWDVLILSGDKDILQLVDDKIRVRDEVRGVEFDTENVIKRFGIRPDQLVDYFCLTGDKVDNVVGITGVGEKTASTLLAQYGSLETIYSRLSEMKPALTEKLQQGRDHVFENRNLIRLKDDVPLGFESDDLKIISPNPEKLGEVLKALEFRGELFGVSDSPLMQAGEVNTRRRVHVVLTKNDLAALAKELEIAAGAEIAYDLETDGLKHQSCDIVGVSLSVVPDEAWYIPIGHHYLGAPDQLPWSVVQAVLSPALRNSKTIKIGQNLKFDNSILTRYGLEPVGPFVDCMLAAYCLDPSRNSFGLKDLAQNYLNERMTRIEELIGPKAEKTFVTVDIDKAASYAGADSEVALRLSRVLIAELKKFHLMDLFEKLEMPLIRVIQSMENSGVRIDTEYLRQVGRAFEAKRNAIEEEIYTLIGERFVLNSPKQLGVILFEKLKLPVVKKTKTGYSTDEDVLRKLSGDHPICEKIIQYRQLAKLISTYVDSLIELADPKTHRIHTSFHQTGTATGRLSSTDPNLQNIPIKTEYGREIRRAFIASDNCILVSVDYSQIDLRALAHMSEDPVLIRTFRDGGDVHTATAAEVFHMLPSDVTPEMRRKAKAINFGIVYGQQAYGLSQGLNIPQREAQEFISKYFDRYAGVRAWIESTLSQARQNGFVSTISGRRRFLPDINSKNASIRGFAERIAINTPIQGSSADIIKAAMINVQALLDEKQFVTRMLVQVHDELLFDVPLHELEVIMPLIRENMESAYRLRVPLVVDIKQGNNWNDMQKIKDRIHV